MTQLKSSKFLFSKKIAVLMDSKFELFGFRFGLDGLVGFIPGIGDILTSLVSLGIFAEGVKEGLSTCVLARMLLNIVIDNLLSKIPILGLVLDFFWKANVKNVELLERYQLDSKKTARRSTLFIISSILIALILLISCIALLTQLLIWFWQILH